MQAAQCDSAEHMDECNILFSYIIIIIIAVQWTRPLTHTLPHTHARTCIKGDFRFIQVASFSFVGELWLGGGGGHGSREGIAINP